MTVETVTLSTGTRSVTLDRNSHQRIDEAMASINDRPAASVRPEPGTHLTIEIPDIELFVDADGNLQPYRPAPDLAALGDRQIDMWPELGKLQRCRGITYLWKREGGKRKAEYRLGNLKVNDDLERYRSTTDFTIWIAADNCRLLAMTSGQIEAALYHQLRAADLDPKTRAPRKVQPDLVTFLSELRNYGAWTSELQDARDVFEQVELPIMALPYGGAL